MPPGLSASITLLFREAAPVDRPALARDAGFDAVEIQDLREYGTAAALAAVGAAGLPVALVNVGMGDLLDGGPGLSGVPGREAAFRRAFDESAAVAERLDARLIHLGPCRLAAATSRDAAIAAYRRNIDYAVQRAEQGRFGIVIEGLNRRDAPDVLIGGHGEAAQIARLYPGALAIIFDAYHAARDGHDPAAAFLGCMDCAAHVQFADTPGRNEPGTGTTDFAGFFSTVAASGFAGYLGAEYVPSAGTAASLGWLGDWRGAIETASGKFGTLQKLPG